MNDTSFNEQIADAVREAWDHPGIEHSWLNAFSCIDPTDEFAAQIGHEVIRRVMAANPYHEDVLRIRRHVILSFNAS